MEAMTLLAGDIVQVVGESYRQDALLRVATRCTGCGPYLDELSGYARSRAEEDLEGRWFRAALLREPDNPVDANAIAVHAVGVGHIGYLSREDAIAYSPIFSALERHGTTVGTCPAFLIGGTAGKEHYGVLLCLSSPRDVVRDLDATPAGV